MTVVQRACEPGKSRTPSSPSRPGDGYHRKPLPRSPAPVLALAESTLARTHLVGELAAIASVEGLTDWALRQLAVKNALTAEDAAAVESAFQARLEQVTQSEAPLPAPSARAANEPSPAPGAPVSGPVKAAVADLDPRAWRATAADGPDGRSGGIDKSLLAISEPRRYRDKGHLKFVALQACLICGRQPSDPHHLAFVQPRALGRKVSDEFAVPLCRTHHREVHRCGDEAGWWKTYKLDPLTAAAALWAQTRLVPAIPQAASFEQPKPNGPTTTTASAVASRKRQNRKTNPITEVGTP